MFPRLTGSENNILIIIVIVFHLQIISLAHVYFCNQTIRVKISYSSQHSHIMLFQNAPFVSHLNKMSHYVLKQNK